ncbi:MAG TPA: NADH-quinone oxidoreductase subunit L [Stellaceae bacterium]|nr:NADH-quinone oxidoreductase subunit L [Stellaceae bacterium]
MTVAAIFLPLLGAVIAGFFGRWISDRGAQLVACAGLILSAVFGVLIFVDVVFHGHSTTTELFTWIDTGELQVNWALRFDPLSAVMVAVVTVVSSMVHIYSIGYMAHDKGIPRFMSYLSFFTFFMLMLVTADNFVQLFFGWEGVGLCSYLLVGFWYDRPSANAAAIKAFVVNRIGDFGFLLGIFAVYALFGSLHFGTVFDAAPNFAHTSFTFLGWQVDALTVTCILLFIGAMGKSAQIGLHVWLPDAMEGPTPVSALIHAATMVTAGVFMVARLSPLFEYAPIALAVVCVVGGTTAMFAATIGMAQNDIKRVIAYSTCSQLGYMFFAAGVSAYSAAIFHLMTHAFFKALLFLGSGSVIHAMSGEQDMRKMGGLWRLIPVTYALMWIGSLALAGIPPFAGYFSKDAIIESAWASGTGFGHYAFWLGTLAAFLTAFYSWRLIFLTFHGKSRAEPEVLHHVHESPKVMILPLFVLAAGAIFAGWLGYNDFVGQGRDNFWRDSILVLPQHASLVAVAAHQLPAWVETLPLVMGLSGIAVAWLAYIWQPGIPAMAAHRFRAVYRFLLNKWYFDELYDATIVRPVMALGVEFWKTGDGAVIDGLGPDGVAETTTRLAVRASRLQTGYLYHYAFVMLIGVVLLVSWYLLRQLGG